MPGSEGITCGAHHHHAHTGYVAFPQAKFHQREPETSKLGENTRVRARVLCRGCHGENDELFRYCQWCAESETNVHSRYRHCDAPLDIDEGAISKRYTQYQSALAAKASIKSRGATMELFSNFLASRKSVTCSI